MSTPLNGADLATINAAMSLAVQNCIESMSHPDIKQQRGIDFPLIDRALAAAQRLVETQGADTVLPAMQHNTPAGLLAYVRNVANSAEPFRPKAKRS